MGKIDNIKPSLVSVQEATGVFGDTEITYSSSAVTYNDANQVYGGSSFPKAKLSVMISVDAKKATADIKSIKP